MPCEIDVVGHRSSRTSTTTTGRCSETMSGASETNYKTAGGILESEMKETRRTHGHPGHECRPR